MLYKAVCDMLEKLTPENCHVLIKEFKNLNIDTVERLKGVTDLIYEKVKY